MEVAIRDLLNIPYHSKDPPLPSRKKPTKKPYTISMNIKKRLRTTEENNRNKHNIKWSVCQLMEYQ